MLYYTSLYIHQKYMVRLIALLFRFLILCYQSKTTLYEYRKPRFKR